MTLCVRKNTTPDNIMHCSYHGIVEAHYNTLEFVTIWIINASFWCLCL